jgi:3'(2'), 5'-bisphosphate nucleotidase
VSVTIDDEVKTRLIELAEAAGEAILEVYESGYFKIDTKADDSPITKADLSSHKILAELNGYLDLPLISEEGRIPDYAERGNWPAHWLIDPLDGTKEFIQRNGEFTVNIALIEAGKPTFGVVHVPVTGATYFGGANFGAFRLEAGKAIQIHASKVHDGPNRVVVSRNHMNAETKAYLASTGRHEAIATGSSLKMLRIAEGAADAYPRLGPTMEWDTAAAQAIIEGAGGVLISNGKPLAYNRENLVNPHFLAATPWFVERHPTTPVVGA